MDFLKWIFKAGLVLALMFLGLKSEPKKDGSDDQSSRQAPIVRVLI